MSITEASIDIAIETPATLVDMKLEVVAIPVSDVDRAKQFYSKLGWRLDADFDKGEAFRGVQFTPPGSTCSLHFGRGVTSAAPGSAQGLFLVVSDIEAARAKLLAQAVQVSDVFHGGPGETPGPGRDPSLENPGHGRIVIHDYRWRLSLAEDDVHYERLERRLAEGPVIPVPTITLDGDADGVVTASDGSSYAGKFSSKRTHRIVADAGHKLPRGARQAFA